MSNRKSYSKYYKIPRALHKTNNSTLIDNQYINFENEYNTFLETLLHPELSTIVQNGNDNIDKELLDKINKKLTQYGLIIIIENNDINIIKLGEQT